jgi:hypothetical protein
LNTEQKAYEIYRSYLKIKWHFNINRPEFDLAKHVGTTTSVERFRKRPDNESFWAMARKFSIKQARNFLVANMVARYSGFTMLEWRHQDSFEAYHKWQKRNNNLIYTFDTELSDLFLGVDDFFDPFLLNDQSVYPEVLDKYFTEEISPETLVFLNHHLKLFATWDGQITDEMVWPERQYILEQYGYFIVKGPQIRSTKELLLKHRDDV